MIRFNIPTNIGVSLTAEDRKAMYDLVAELMEAAMGPFTEGDDVNVYRLKGAVFTKDSNANPPIYSVTDGWLFYNKEIYKIDAATIGAHASNIPVLNIEVTDTPDEPHQTSDGNNIGGTHVVKSIAKFVPALGSSGSGLIDASALIDSLPIRNAAALDDKADANHTHTGFADVNHTHTGFATTSHLHDDRYSLDSHLHDDRYSLDGHDHDDRYSLLSHDHSGQYSEPDHNHDGVYATPGDISTLQGQINGLSGFQIGMILMYSGPMSNFPDDGTNKGRGVGAYSDFAVCNGQNNTVDLRGKFIVGKSDNQASNGNPDYNNPDYNNLGDDGGAKTVTLTESQMPIHNHNITGDKIQKDGSLQNGITALTRGTDTNLGTSTFTDKIANKGGGQAHENRPPYYTLAFIQKIA